MRPTILALCLAGCTAQQGSVSIRQRPELTRSCEPFPAPSCLPSECVIVDCVAGEEPYLCHDMDGRKWAVVLTPAESRAFSIDDDGIIETCVTAAVR